MHVNRMFLPNEFPYQVRVSPLVITQSFGIKCHGSRDSCSVTYTQVPLEASPKLSKFSFLILKTKLPWEFLKCPGLTVPETLICC